MASRIAKVMRVASALVSHPLNRSNRFGAVSRFVRWQIASRMIASPIALQFAGGTRLLTQPGMTGATGNWYFGLHEPAEMGFVLHALRAGDLFLDVGANVGSYTVLAAGAVGARVVSVEPLPATFARLRANVRLNDIAPLVEAHCCGLSDRDGELRFTSARDTMNRVALPGELLPTTTVPVTTLDGLCEGRIPRVVKIDVEGHELAVLDGGGVTLGAREVEAVLMETNASGAKFGVSDDALIARMGELGFTACGYDPFARRLSAATRADKNMIFVRDLERMNARCRLAPSFPLVNGSI